MKKLNLNKERIASLTDNGSGIKGGGTDNSTDRTFTCCWCTDTNSDGGPCQSRKRTCTPDASLGCPEE